MFDRFTDDAQLGPCGLQALANPQLLGAGPGLQWDDERVQVLKAAFPCCEGRGVRDDFEANVSRRCQLQSRLSHVRQLMRDYAGIWGSDRRYPGFARPLPAEFGSSWESVLAEHARASSEQGLALLSPEPNQAEAWPLALAATWRFGIATHVVHLERSPQPAQQMPADLGQHGPAMVVVEGAERLWDARLVDRLLALVLVCRNAGYPLWLFAGPASPTANAARAALRREDARPGGQGGYGARRPGQVNFDQRLARLRNRLPWEWLAPDELALLQQVTRLPRPQGPNSHAKKQSRDLRAPPKRNKTDELNG